MADSHYKSYTIKKASDVKSVVRKSFITRAQYEFEGGNAVVSGTLVLENIMGEEDIFRYDDMEPSGRADNALTGRIIWSSGVKANSRVYYSPETATLHLDSGLQDDPVETDGVVYHEIFLSSLDIDTLYAFQVESYDADGNSLRSETYWFHTHGSIVLENSGLDIVVALLVEVIDLAKNVEQEVPTTVVALSSILFSGDLSSEVVVVQDTINVVETLTQDEGEFFTEIITS